MHPFVILALVLALPFVPLQSEPCAATLTVGPPSGPVGTVVTIIGRAFTTACPLLRGTNGDGLIVQSAGGTSTFGYAPVAGCRFVLGFATLHSLLPQLIGQCLDDEQHNPTNGYGLQHTTNPSTRQRMGPGSSP
jgi:hypothetical protein